MNFEELVEKDWSFLESDNPSSKEHDKKIDQIISAANIAENSKVLVSIGSEEFVDRLVDSSPCQLLLVVHESILSLACIKERHERHDKESARVVISPLQGRQALEQQRQKYPDIVVSDLPEKMKLEKVASEHSFWLKDFVDDSSLYLAVLELKE
ncbi:Vacuolar protein sorting-associated protein 16-like protein [Bienertia sinuspersici]